MLLMEPCDEEMMPSGTGAAFHAFSSLVRAQIQRLYDRGDWDWVRVSSTPVNSQDNIEVGWGRGVLLNGNSISLYASGF